MNYSEIPVVFESSANNLVGIISVPDNLTDLGVLIIVGGPQYRVGSHRQFVLMSRYLAENGIPVLRFDYTGMGDSDGGLTDFENVENDIIAAIDVFISNTTGVNKIVLWGLCDAASASMMFAYKDCRVCGMVLANPWARSEESLARTFLFHYYANRLFGKQFWKKLLKGKVNPLKSVGSLLENVLVAIGVGSKQNKQKKHAHSSTLVKKQENYIDRMQHGLQNFDGPVQFILSEKDLTAAEFLDTVSRTRQWRKIMQKPSIVTHEVLHSNHTFSKQEWRSEVDMVTLKWLRNNFEVDLIKNQIN